MTKEFTFDTNLFSDLYKDAFGFRPRGHRFYDEATTDAERQEIWDYTCECLTEALERMENAEIQSDIRFEELITDCITLGAGDRETAIRWIFQGDGITVEDLRFHYGFGYIQYEYGISEKYRDEVTLVLNSMLQES